MVARNAAEKREYEKMSASEREQEGKTGLDARSVMKSVTPRRKRRCAEETPCEVARGTREEQHRGRVFWGVVQSLNMKDCSEWTV